MRYEVAIDAEFELRPRRADWKVGDPPEPIDIWFQGRRFLWHPGSETTYPILTTPAANSDDWHDDQLAVARFLSALSATHMWGLRAAARWEGTMVPREEFDTPTWTEPRGAFHIHRVTPELVVPIDDGDRLRCLGLMREARNSNSAALRLLTYWKVIEVCVEGDERKLNDWVNVNVRQLEEPWARDAGVPRKEIRQKDWFGYFKEARVAAAHAIPRGSEPFTIDPDDPTIRNRLQIDGHKIQLLAVRAVIEKWEQPVIENDPPAELLGQNIPW